MNDCSVCLNNTQCVKQEFTHCPANHSICKDCFIRLLNICFCNNKQGDIVYICSICRNEHIYTNKEVYKILMELQGDSTLYTTPHSICKSEFNIPYFIRKCIFRDCGCREQSKDLEINSNITNDFRGLISEYMKSPR